MKDSATRQRFIEMRVAGQSYADIAVELKVAKQTLINWSREYQVEIANLKAIEFDSLQRRHKLNAEARVEMFGVMLDRLREEFSKRDLSALPTEKLLDQITKVSSSIARDSTSPTFWERRVEPLAAFNIDTALSFRDDHWPA